MTSFDDFEISREQSKPLEIYSIVLGTETFRWTSAEDTLTVSALDYVPIPISRSQTSQTADARNKDLTITVPGDNDFASRYIDIVPGVKATVSITRLQRDESPVFDTQILIFKGQVLSVRFPDDGHTAEILVRSQEAALNRSVPRFTFMASCNHVLYDSRCGVDPAQFDHTGNVSAVSGSVITVDGAAASGLDFTGGFCTPVSTTDFRMILSQSGDDLTLLLPFQASPLSQNVQVFAGCDRLAGGDCGQVFDNVINFGGFPFVPNRNPFRGGGLDIQ